MHLGIHPSRLTILHHDAGSIAHVNVDELVLVRRVIVNHARHTAVRVTLWEAVQLVPAKRGVVELVGDLLYVARYAAIIHSDSVHANVV